MPVKYIYSVSLSDLSDYWASSVIYHLWWRELGRLPDWTNECKCSARVAWVSSHIPSSPHVFSSLSIHSKSINKCGMSFTVAAERLIFIKKGRNGHLLASAGTCLCFDSDGKPTWQLNYILSTCFSVLFRWWESSQREWPSWLKTCEAAFMAAPVLSPVSFGTSVCHMILTDI